MKEAKQDFDPYNILAGATDLDLLEIIRSKESFNETEVHLAFTMFYNRHGDYLKNAIKIICRSHPNAAELADIVFSNTMFYVYSYQKEFSISGETDANSAAQRIKGWLFIIAKYELQSALSSGEQVFSPDDIEQEYHNFFQQNEIEELDSSINEKLVDEALNKVLSERDSHLLRTYFLYYEDGKNIPSSIRQELVERYGITDENFRAIISRSKKKVKEYLESIINIR